MTTELQETTGWAVQALRPAALTLLTRTGSRAYGTDHPESDHDFRGVYCTSLRSYCGLTPLPKTIDVSEPHDTVLYELHHFAQLAAKGNPTALEILWGEDYTAGHLGETLRASRISFLSKRIMTTYGGYARSQIKRAKAAHSKGGSPISRTKPKQHTLRLLRVGQHALATGDVMVRLPEDEIAILKAQAELPLDKFITVAQLALEAMDATAEVSPLPDEPDKDAIDYLLYKIRVAS